MNSRNLCLFWRLASFALLLIASTSLQAQQAPSVLDFVINGGASQRSTVLSIAIRFSEDVGASLQADDLHLTNLTTNSPVSGSAFSYDPASKTGSWTFPTLPGRSLPDGNYDAFIRPADVVSASGVQLRPSDSASTWSTKFFRYFGDFDGDRDVDLLDTAKMRKTDLRPARHPDFNPAADVNGDSTINDVDLAAFQAHYLSVLSGHTVAPKILNSPVRTGAQTVTLTGTAAPNTRVVITNGFHTYEGVSDENGNFSIVVYLLANRINSLFVGGAGLTATDLSSLTPVTITQDSNPPFLHVDSPSNESTVDSATITVTGRVGDLLSGFDGLSVKVNQVDANITAGIGPNGTFEAQNVPLAMGENFLAVIATDSLGASVTKSVMVTRVARLQMEIVSGNDQSTIRNTELPEPLVVRLWDSNGQAFPDKIVNFQVTRSDGHLSSLQGQTTLADPMMVQVRTDAQGLAKVYWRLGSDSGKSNNLLTVASAGVPGEARFRASADPKLPTQINVGMGNNQIGEAGGTAPLPLTAWVSDNLNGAPEVPVTFRVTDGDAQVAAKGQPNAAPSVVIPTDSTGHVDAYLRFGSSGGPVTVEATFAGLQSQPAVFMSRALVRNPGQPATFNAVVEDNTGLAIGGATCTLNINGIRFPEVNQPPVTSDANGVITFSNVNPGAGFIQVDGRTAKILGGKPFNQPGRFPSLVYRVTIVPNADNPLPTTVYLPTLNPANERTVDGTEDVDLTIQGIDGLKMTIKAGSMTLADGTKPTPARPIAVSLNQVHTDNIPMPIQDGVAPLLTWTLQPPGAHFDPPVQIQYPNMAGLPPGSFTNFLSYNHDIERFEIVASGTVTADGAFIKSDTGSGLLNSGWGCNCPPYSATGECRSIKFELEIEKQIATLLESNLLTVNIEPLDSSVGNVIFEIANDSTWHQLDNSRNWYYDYKCRVANTFRVRARATINGREYRTDEMSFQVLFPNTSVILQGAGVVARMEEAWNNTLANAGPNGWREEGYYILLDTSTESYKIAGYSVGPTVTDTETASVNLPPFPLTRYDSPLHPGPLDKPTYIVADFHTHPPTTFIATPSYRAVGPSEADYEDDFPSFVYDYVGVVIDGVLRIPQGHPLQSPAKIWTTGPTRRTDL